MSKWLTILAVGLALSGCAEDRLPTAAVGEEPVDEDQVDAARADLTDDQEEAGLDLVRVSMTLDVENENWPTTPIEINESSYAVVVLRDGSDLVLRVQNEDEDEEFESLSLTIPSGVGTFGFQDLPRSPSLKGRRTGMSEAVGGSVEIEESRGEETRFVAGNFALQLPFDDTDGARTFKASGTFEVSFEVSRRGD